ncbi:hypothetical protein L1049_020449 [Liquidambar formosana]|uniref:Uncharacterized protein n=1 Tax=Liquidambar formosana TaxID=63359 RepID=A0AAP0S7Z3_LIQFO
MDSKSRVSVPLKLTAVSNKPAEPGKTHPLSALDHAMGLHSLHIIFYYRKYPTGSGDSNQFDLDWLRGSLSEALSLYPTVTGRLTRGEDGNWMVKCNDAGVRILRAKVGTTLDEWLRSADAAEERDLMMWEDMPEDPSIWSPFRIQINDFEGGGAAIALSCSHMHADPTNATMLFKSWTEVHRREPISHPPFYNPPAFGGRGRPVANIDTKSANYYAAKSKAKTPTVKMATATFKFSEAIIKQCLSRVHDKCPDATPFDLLAALFWTRVACLKLPTHDNKSSISICIDFRKLMHAPLPYGSFGNAQHFSLLSLDAVKLDDAGLGQCGGVNPSPCVEHQGRAGFVCYRLV